jgi:hypothetical protein
MSILQGALQQQLFALNNLIFDGLCKFSAAFARLEGILTTALTS